MTTIGYNDIENVLLSLTDPNTWSAVTSVPWVNSPKINAWTSIYNEQGWWGTGIAWWSTNIWWSSTDYNTVRWTSWSIYLPDWTEYTVTGGNTGDMSTMTYIYYDEESGSVLTTTSASDSVWEKKILLCVAWPTTSWKDAEFQAFWTNAQSTFIYADNIAANTITGNEIAANSIKANQIDSWAITTSKLAVWAVDSSAIEDWAVIADKISVDTLSAITGNMWTCYVWNVDSWNWIKIYPYSSSQGRVEFHYNWANIWYIQWEYIYALGYWMVRIRWNNWVYIDWDVYMISRSDVMDLSLAKLRIPVGSNLYN